MKKPQQTEPVLNAKLGELLIQRHPRWDEKSVLIETTQVFRGRPSAQVDVMVASARVPRSDVAGRDTVKPGEEQPNAAQKQ